MKATTSPMGVSFTSEGEDEADLLRRLWGKIPVEEKSPPGAEYGWEFFEEKETGKVELICSVQ